MSKITNDGLTRSGIGRFIIAVLYPYGNSGRQRVNRCISDRMNEWRSYRLHVCVYVGGGVDQHCLVTARLGVNSSTP